MYFNQSSKKSLDRCGVPFSCCTPVALRGGVDGVCDSLFFHISVSAKPYTILLFTFAI